MDQQLCGLKIAQRNNMTTPEQHLADISVKCDHHKLTAAEKRYILRDVILHGSGRTYIVKRNQRLTQEEIRSLYKRTREGVPYSTTSLDLTTR